MCFLCFIRNGTPLQTLSVNSEQKRQRHNSGSSNHSDRKCDNWIQPPGDDQINSSRLLSSLDTKCESAIDEICSTGLQDKAPKLHHKFTPSIDGDPSSSDSSSNAPTPPPPPPVEMDNRYIYVKIVWCRNVAV